MAEAASEKEAARLQLAVQTAVQLVDGCDHASIATVGSATVGTAGLVTRAASSPVAQRADELQGEVGPGPCADAVRGRGTVVEERLGTDERWPGWSTRVRAELGIESVASLWLDTGEEGAEAFRGALNLYGNRPQAFGPAGLETARVLAERIGVGVTAGRESDELNAVGTRTLIGRAEGILMERLGIDAPEASAYLRRAADHAGVKVAQVALDLVRTRELPVVPPAP